MSDEQNLISNTVTIYHAVSILNDALKYDHKAMESLFSIMVPCNDALANSNNVETLMIDKSSFAVTLLGIINSIFAYTVQNSYYRIFPVFDSDNNLIEFRLGILDTET